MALHRRKHRKRMVAEINVVPYIDVMLVLLIIFRKESVLLIMTAYILFSLLQNKTEKHA